MAFDGILTGPLPHRIEAIIRSRRTQKASCLELDPHDTLVAEIVAAALNIDAVEI